MQIKPQARNPIFSLYSRMYSLKSVRRLSLYSWVTMSHLPPSPLDLVANRLRGTEDIHSHYICGGWWEEEYSFL